MVKRWLLVSVMLLMSLLAVGCGVAQEQHDAVVGDLSRAQAELQSAKAELQSVKAQLQSVQGELEAGQANVAELTSNLEESQTELEAIKSEYGSFTTEVKREWTSLDGYLELNHYVLGINAELLRNDLDEIQEGCLLVTGRLATLGDSKLQALWEPAYVVEGEEWNLYFDPFYVFMEEHASRIGSKAKAIKEKLAE